MPSTARTRVVVADDEPLARRGVCQLLEAHADMVVVGESRNGSETLMALEQLAPDLLFLDVQMPEMNGFDVLSARRPERMPVVVFVTAHDQFAVRAFEAQALDYLVKPINVARFEATLARVRERLQLMEGAERARRLEAVLAAPRTVERFVIPSANGDLVIAVDEVDWIGAEDYYACLYVKGKRHLTRDSLASLEATLDPRRFVRVHRGAIVRLDRIREVRATAGGDELVLRDGTTVPISRRRRRALGDALRS